MVSSKTEKTELSLKRVPDGLRGVAECCRETARFSPPRENVSPGRRLLPLLAAVMAPLFPAQFASACSVCFGDPNSPMVQGAVAGIYVLLGITAFVLSGVLGTGLFWIHRSRTVAGSADSLTTIDHVGIRMRVGRSEQLTLLEQGPSGSAGPRRLCRFLAILTACAVFPLLFVGAGVTSKDAGMIFPDWPTSGGHLVNPPGWTSSDKTLWEHGHRLIGWTVGILATALALVSWRCRGSLRWVGFATFLAIGVQGVLGGARVTEVSTELAMIHGIWGQVCFCLAGVTALLSTSAWHEPSRVALPGGDLLRTGCLINAMAVFVQLVLGATFRHFAYGSALVAHVLWAIIVVMTVGWISMSVLGASAYRGLPALLAKAQAATMTLQLFLGGLSWLATFVPQPPGASPPVWRWAIPTIHVAVGALLLNSAVLLALLTRRLSEPSLNSTRVAPAVTA